jgi:hypothetical protein
MTAHASLLDSLLLFVDCQTTGATPEKGELLDLAWTIVLIVLLILMSLVSAR